MIEISFHVVLLCFILIFPALIPTSITAETLEYKACSANLSCGSITNIGYPFWGGNRPQFCGIRAFQLTCPNTTSEYPSIDIGMPKWEKLLSISTSPPRIIVALARFLRSDRVCHDTRKNSMVTLTNSFKLTSNDHNISIFYSCPGSVLLSNLTKSYGCLYKNGTNGSVFYFMNRSGSLVDSEIKSCRVRFTVPVFVKDLNELNNGNATLVSVLNKGFELEYEANMTACFACRKSGGYCGSSRGLASEFVCHCSTGSSSLLCPESENAGRRKPTVTRAGIIAVGTASGVVMVALLVICLRKRHSICSKFMRIRGTILKDNQNVEAFLKSYGSLAPKQYTYKNIKKMTNSFKEKLGGGGYGHVYKGTLVEGHSVAVKVLHKLTGDGEEFLNEVLSISKTNHVNIVTLLGFCIEGNKRALVYEFLPNGSLDKFIHGAGSAKTLPTETMFSIAVGIAKGLDYLHQGCKTRILHFDIKPHNILLDEHFCPKISDFGLARLFPKEQSHLSMFEARGTIGYIAPEICCRNFGGISHKSDVYSFGMMILDMVCGRKNVFAEFQDSIDEDFPQWIYDQLEIDEEIGLLQGIKDVEERKLQKKMMLVSLWCIQTYPANRPSMNKVVEMLEGSFELLQMPPKPYLSSSSVSAFDSGRSEST